MHLVHIYYYILYIIYLLHIQIHSLPSFFVYFSITLEINAFFHLFPMSPNKHVIESYQDILTQKSNFVPWNHFASQETGKQYSNSLSVILQNANRLQIYFPIFETKSIIFWSISPPVSLPGHCCRTRYKLSLEEGKDKRM
jgi:hypothetical protein